MLNNFKHLLAHESSPAKDFERSQTQTENKGMQMGLKQKSRGGDTPSIFKYRVKERTRSYRDVASVTHQLAQSKVMTFQEDQTHEELKGSGKHASHSSKRKIERRKKKNSLYVNQAEAKANKDLEMMQGIFGGDSDFSVEEDSSIRRSSRSSRAL